MNAGLTIVQAAGGLTAHAFMCPGLAGDGERAVLSHWGTNFDLTGQQWRTFPMMQSGRNRLCSCDFTMSTAMSYSSLSSLRLVTVREFSGINIETQCPWTNLSSLSLIIKNSRLRKLKWTLIAVRPVCIFICLLHLTPLRCLTQVWFMALQILFLYMCVSEISPFLCMTINFLMSISCLPRVSECAAWWESLHKLRTWHCN